MKRTMGFVIILILGVTAGACSPKPLQPGDKIGDMELLNMCEGTNIVEVCPYNTLLDGTCKVKPAAYMWLSAGWTEKTTEELDLTFKDSSWKLFFDDHEVDIEAFGTYDVEVTDPVNGPVKGRVWNFCVGNITPGVHHLSYEHTFKYGSRPGFNIENWTFTVLNE